ncbi:MAG: hypothetical protein ABI411_12335 [Tahibacter sp.]
MRRTVGVRSILVFSTLLSAASAAPIPTPVLDTSFGKPAVLFDRPGGLLDLGKSLLVQPDGKMVVVAESNGSAAPTLGAAVRRVLPSGSADTAYGTKVVPLHHELVSDAVLDAQSNVYIVGLEGSDARVVRLTPAGAMDAGFSADGAVDVDLGQGLYDVPTGLALDEAGRLLMSGQTFGGSVLVGWGSARLLDDGTADTSYMGTGSFVYNQGAGRWTPTNPIPRGSSQFFMAASHEDGDGQAGSLAAITYYAPGYGSSGASVSNSPTCSALAPTGTLRILRLVSLPNRMIVGVGYYGTTTSGSHAYELLVVWPSNSTIPSTIYCDSTDGRYLTDVVMLDPNNLVAVGRVGDESVYVRTIYVPAANNASLTSTSALVTWTQVGGTVAQLTDNDARIARTGGKVVVMATRIYDFDTDDTDPVLARFNTDVIFYNGAERGDGRSF